MDRQEIEEMQDMLFTAVRNHVKQQARTKLPEKGITGLSLGISLMVMQIGGIVGSKLILKVKGVPYAAVFAGIVLAENHFFIAVKYHYDTFTKMESNFN